MSRLSARIYELAVIFGVDTRQTFRALRGLPAYFADRKELRRQSLETTAAFEFGRPFPCFGDRSSEGGAAKGHYFHQDLLVARRIFLNNPDVHIDVGSRVDGFVAHVASYRAIKVLDIRPIVSTISNIEFIQADMMQSPAEHLVDLCDSISCLHALEHFGLGRYGDPVHYDGHLLGLDNLHRLLKRGGTFYLSVPIGRQRIEFNAHRVFSVEYLLRCLEGRYHLDRFSFVDDNGDLHEDCPTLEGDIRSNFGCSYGCGIFEFTKL